jgi:Zn-dependent protease/predicted transcriptional regulator
MRWSWKLGEFRGIGVYMHATFLILIAIVVLGHWSDGNDLTRTLQGVLFVLALFACVVLHEFGHALTAARYGIRTRDITLLPIGGVARLERMPREPRQELWVALAGPAVNGVIAGLLFAWLRLTGGFAPLEQLTVASGPFLERLLAVNVLLVAFNLLPAFPMDGGRILRALLATRLEYTRATQIAANVGQGMALLFGLFGMFYNPFLVFIALFVWIGAAGEASMARVAAALDGIPAARAMVTGFTALSPDEPLGRAVDHTLAGWQQDFPVVEDDRVVGILTQPDLVKGLTEKGRDARVREVMRTDFRTVDASEMMETVFERMQGCACRTLPVIDRGRLVGLVTTQNVGELVAIESALTAGRRGTR